MKFADILKEQKNKDKLQEILKSQLCNNCLGRQFGMLGHGMTNAGRGEILREGKEPENCEMCNNFFKQGINKTVADIIKKIKGVEFETFLMGTIPTDEMERRQEALWERIGLEDVEPIKSEVNREVGKRIEKSTDKKFSLDYPDVTIMIDMKKDEIRLVIRSLYVSGGYKKFIRGIPQSKWTCLKCNGKGCVNCKGEGKLYPTSVQEIIDKPLLKATGAKKSRFSGAGREDIDARCLDWRPFVLELVKPLKRSIDLKKTEKQVNKSKKVNVKGLKLVAGKDVVRALKAEKFDKTYRAEVVFEKPIDKKKLKDIRKLAGMTIMQKTPLRVVHRRADLIRKRGVRSISWKVLGSKKLQLTIRGESGLYIKELIHGDQGRTNPNISEIIGNTVKKIELDVIKIWSGR